MIEKMVKLPFWILSWLKILHLVFNNYEVYYQSEIFMFFEMTIYDNFFYCFACC